MYKSIYEINKYIGSRNKSYAIEVYAQNDHLWVDVDESEVFDSNRARIPLTIEEAETMVQRILEYTEELRNAPWICPSCHHDHLDPPWRPEDKDICNQTMGALICGCTRKRGN